MNFMPVGMMVFAVVFVLAVIIIVLALVQGRRQSRELAALAASQGLDLVPKPETKRQDLLGYLQPTRFINTIEGSGHFNRFDALLQGEVRGRSLLFFRHTHNYARFKSSASGSARTGSMGSGGVERNTTAVFVLITFLARPLTIPPVWFKRAGWLDVVFALTGLRRVKLGDPSVDAQFHFFCDEPECVRGFATADVLEFCGKLLKGDMVYVDPRYMLLANTGFRGAEWFKGALERQDLFCRWLESQAPAASEA